MSDAGASARTALVLTASDRSAAGTREDASGTALAGRLTELGFTATEIRGMRDRGVV